MKHRIVHLSDLHTAGGRPVITHLATALAAQPEPIEAIIITGDLIERGHADQYPGLADQLAPLAQIAPLVVTLGNHDDPRAAHVLPGHRAAHHFAVDTPQLRIIALDSAPSRFGDAQLRFLDEALDCDRDVVVAMHHPPFPKAIPDLIAENFSHPEQFARTVAGRARLILCGHCHQVGAGSIAGLPVWIGPSLSYQRLITTDQSSPSGWHEHPGPSLEFSVVDLDATDYQVAAVHLDVPAERTS